jgi:hypothetical protein
MFQPFRVSPTSAAPPWLALASSPMVAFLVMASTEPNATQDRAGLGSLAAFLLHTCVAYTCAPQLSPWLVFHWFGWVMPILNVSANTPATDWYLQHFERMTIPPAVLVDTSMSRAFYRIPFAISCRKTVIRLHPGPGFSPPWCCHTECWNTTPHRLCCGAVSMTAAKYFFEIVKVMPTVQNPLARDPIRAWAQMSVTAPFYAGVAYILGALASQHKVVERTFTFEKHDEATADHDPGV